MKKFIRIFLLILIIIGLGLIFTQDRWVPNLVNMILSSEKNTTPVKLAENTSKPSNAISITSIDIKEANFTGKKSVVTGDGLLASESNKYIEATVAEFKTEADKDVPDMRKQFGADNPTADYTIDISAKENRSTKNDAIIISVYTFTGGAHGSSYYKVFNTSRTSGKIFYLADVVKANKQFAFTNLVKSELNNWKPDGTTVVFPDEVNALTFASFKNWTLDDKNLTIYFDQYEIGPGVLGEIAFPISLEKVKDFLN